MKQAARLLAASPKFFLVSAVMIAVGVAGTTLVFSVVNALLLKDSRLPDLSRVINVAVTDEGQTFVDIGLKESRWQALRLRPTVTVTHLSAVRHLRVAFEGRRRARAAMAESVTADYFNLFDVNPEAGRLLGPADGVATNCCSVVIAHRLALEEFGAPPLAVGQQVRVSGRPFVVVGVVRDEFRGLTMPNVVGAELWFNRDTAHDTFDIGQTTPSMVFARLQTGATFAEAKREIEEVGRGIDPASANIGLTAVAAEAATMPTGARRAGMAGSAILLGVSALILIAGVGNLTSLYIVRGARRASEMAIRIALGASAREVATLFVAEILIVTAAGAIIGGPLAVLGAQQLQHSGFPEIGGLVADLDLMPDIRIALFVVGITTVTAIAISLNVLKRVLRAESLAVLARGANGGLTVWEKRNVRTALALQVASAIALLVPSGLLLNSARVQSQMLPQFEDTRTLIGRVDLGLQNVDEQQGRSVYASVLSEISNGSVESGALGSDLPIEGRGPLVRLGTIGSSAAVRGHQLAVSPGFFQFIGSRLERGRLFDPTDRAGAEPVAILSETAARNLLGDNDPIGGRISLGDRGPRYTVIGVVSDISTGTSESRRYIYLPQLQVNAPSMMVLVRLHRDLPVRVDVLRDLVRRADPHIALLGASTLHDHVQASAIALRNAAGVCLVLSMVAWLICLGGVYAAAEYASGARRREFGVRMALGARRTEIVSLIAKQMVNPVIRGLAAGWAVAVLVVGIIQFSWLPVLHWNWASLLGAPLLAAIVCFLAAAVPAWKTSGLDPKASLYD
jgi:putative ABC transport system permease protein